MKDTAKEINFFLYSWPRRQHNSNTNLITPRVNFFPYGSTAPKGPRPPHFSRFRDHTL
jgi:hypothetical protein